MDCKKFKVSRLICGVAAGAIAIAPLAANAQMATDSTMMSSTTMTAPMQVTGTVLRYYVDRSGYVTAMDIQTANGIEMVRFSPGMGQRLYTTYPVGGQASVYVSGSPTSRWDVVGIGATAPTSMMPSMLTDVELLESEPYILTGAKLMTMSGKLTNLILNDMGEVLGLVLDNNTLVRTPRESRHIAPGQAGTARVSPFFKGADVEVTGYPEAPRYGVLSQYGNRVVANALVVNGRAVGALGIPMMNPESTRAVFNNVDLGGAAQTPEEVRAMGAGYRVYTPMSNTMMDSTMMNTTGTAAGTGTMSGGTTMTR